jgi:serine/threonine protein phosphatase PrpC
MSLLILFPLKFALFPQEDESVGAFCITTVLQNGCLVVSNAGDCRAVLSRAGKAWALTSDHRASQEDEESIVREMKIWYVQDLLAFSFLPQTLLMQLNNA